mmetsp:Transcript_875/g.2362  ORF Transcript_875/g.2362 Transcript_875/m.2362 type:complete len:206 (+) Transcript_875:329-946(+)
MRLNLNAPVSVATGCRWELPAALGGGTLVLRLDESSAGVGKGLNDMRRTSAVSELARSALNWVSRSASTRYCSSLAYERPCCRPPSSSSLSPSSSFENSAAAEAVRAGWLIRRFIFGANPSRDARPSSSVAGAGASARGWGRRLGLNMLRRPLHASLSAVKGLGRRACGWARSWTVKADKLARSGEGTAWGGEGLWARAWTRAAP